LAGLVLELQKDALDSSVPIAPLLRKALVVAKKLEIDDFRLWIEKELNGYTPGGDEIPQYREVEGIIKAWNPYNGWIPVIVQDEKMAKHLRRRKVKQSIRELESLVENQKDSSLMIHYSPEIENMLMEDDPFQPALHIGANSIHGIIDCVRNTVLEWSLKLEKEGILGEGLSFSVKEKEKAQNNPDINIQNFQGILGNVNQSTITQNLEIEIKKNDIQSLTDFLKSKGVTVEDIFELKKAINEDPKQVSPKGFGEKVSGWIGKMITKAATGTWDIGIQVAGTILAKAISLYYGMPC
jgi:hypothetical protein